MNRGSWRSLGQVVARGGKQRRVVWVGRLVGRFALGCSSSLVPHLKAAHVDIQIACTPADMLVEPGDAIRR